MIIFTQLLFCCYLLICYNKISCILRGRITYEFQIISKTKTARGITEHFTVSYPLTITLPDELTSLDTLLNATLKCETAVETANAAVTFTADATLGKEAYRLDILSDGIHISYATRTGAFYGLITLGQILSQCESSIPYCKIVDEPALSVRGYMLDISRGKVPTLEDLCGYVDRLAELKYNQLQLYVEGFSFAYPSYTEVWKDATPITGEEIRYPDSYCEKQGIELVPNQNGLGHMAAWLSRDEFRHLAETEHGMKFMGSAMPTFTWII